MKSTEGFVHTDINQFRKMLSNLRGDEDFEASSDLLNVASNDIMKVFDKLSNIYSGLLPVQYELTFHKDDEDLTLDYIVIGMKGDEFVEKDAKNAFKVIDIEMRRYKGSSNIFYWDYKIINKPEITGILFFELDN